MFDHRLCKRNLLGWFSWFSVLSILSVLIHTNAQANGATWNPGTISGTPGPVKQNDLILEREHVVFKDGKINAHFWIYNPSNKEIKVMMGFPIDYKDRLQRYHIKSDAEYTETFLKTFTVSIDEKKVESKPLKNNTSEYSLVYLWEMSFSPQRVTEYTVEYPMQPIEKSMDHEGGTSIEYTFQYITHTGSYWARPIKEATLEYCDRAMINRVLRMPNRINNYEPPQWVIKPKRFEIDQNRNCIIWKRENWQPQKPADDILVSVRWEYNDDHNYLDLPDFETLFKSWCGIAADNRKIEQLGKFVNITDKDMTIEYFNFIQTKAYHYPDDLSATFSHQLLYGMSTHYRTDFQLLLLRYLRNYLFAVHGYDFKDKELSACFKNITHEKDRTATEQWNIEWLLDYEKQINEINKKVWEDIGRNSQ